MVARLVLPEDRMDTVGIVTFTLAGETYGIAAMVVREIAKAVDVSPLPGAPSMVEGAIEYLGVTMPVVDLRARFGLGSRGSSAPAHFIIAESARRLIALDVDSVVSMMEVPAEWVEIDSLEPLTAKGLVRTPDGLRVIYDVNRVLDESDAVVLETVLAGSALQSHQ